MDQFKKKGPVSSSTALGVLKLRFCRQGGGVDEMQDIETKKQKLRRKTKYRTVWGGEEY